jgi:hypothetical protein
MNGCHVMSQFEKIKSRVPTAIDISKKKLRYSYRYFQKKVAQP